MVVNLPIIQAGNEAEAQAKALAAAAIALGEDAEMLERADGVFNPDALARLFPVGAFLFFCQRLELGFLDRHGGVGVQMLQALITGINTGLGGFLQADLGEFQHFAIMNPALGHRVHADDFPGFVVNNDLRLQRVALFLS